MDVNTGNASLIDLVVIVPLTRHGWTSTLDISKIKQCLKAWLGFRNSSFVKQTGNALNIQSAVAWVVGQSLQNLKWDNIWLWKLAQKLYLLIDLLLTNLLRCWCWSNCYLWLNNLLARRKPMNQKTHGTYNCK